MKENLELYHDSWANCNWKASQTEGSNYNLTLLFKIVNNLVAIPHDHLLTTAQQRTRGSHSS